MKLRVNVNFDEVSIDSYAVLVFQFLLTLEFVKVLSDIEICGDGEGRDEFLFVSLYAGACVGLLTVESVVHENVRVIDAAIKTGCVVKWIREPFD